MMINLIHNHIENDEFIDGSRVQGFQSLTHDCHVLSGRWSIYQGEKGTINTWNNDRQFGFVPRAESHGTGFQETAIDRGWGWRLIIDWKLYLIIGIYIMFFLLIDYWLLMIGLFGFRWLPVWKSQQNPSKSVAHFKCETTAPRLRFPAIAAVPCPPKYISELRPVEPCWTLNPKPVALATYYPSGKLTKKTMERSTIFNG